MLGTLLELGPVHAMKFRIANVFIFRGSSSRVLIVLKSCYCFMNYLLLIIPLYGRYALAVCSEGSAVIGTRSRGQPALNKMRLFVLMFVSQFNSCCNVC